MTTTVETIGGEVYPPVLPELPLLYGTPTMPIPEHSVNADLSLGCSAKPAVDPSVRVAGDPYVSDADRYRELLSSYEGFYCGEIQRLINENMELRRYITVLEDEITRVGVGRGV